MSRFTIDDLRKMGYDENGKRISKPNSQVSKESGLGKPMWANFDIPTSAIVFNLTPIGKPRLTQRDKWLNPPRKPVAKYWEFKDEIKRQAQVHNFTLGDTFQATFIIPFPDSYSAKKKASLDGKPHMLKPDKDNIEKAVLDCLKVQDCTVWDSRTTKFWGYEGKIIISPLFT